MKTIVGASNWMIEVNLTTGQVMDFQVDEDDRRKYLGGQGLGLKLLYERMDRGVDPLNEKNYLALMMGVLMGTGAPCSGHFSVVTKSPQTGMMQCSACDGPFGMACKTAGYGGLLITGKAPAPVVIDIDENGARIIDATAIQSLDAAAAQTRLNPDGIAGVLAIGPAGGNREPLDNLGGDGLAVVMGAKNLKAVVARGKAYKIVPADPKRFAKTIHLVSGYGIKNQSMGDDAGKSDENCGQHAGIDGDVHPGPRFQDSRHRSGSAMPGEDSCGFLESGPAAGVEPDACHRCTTSFVPEEIPGGLNPSTIRAKVSCAVFFENLSAVINALNICPLTSHTCVLKPLVVKYTPDVFLRLVMRYLPTVTGMRNIGIYAKLWRSVTGFRLNQRQILRAGARIHVLERLMNTGEGISRKDDILSRNVWGVGGQGDAGELALQPMLSAYYRLRGYDLRGIPTAKTLQRLGIEPKWDLNKDPRLAHFKILSPGGRPIKHAYLLIMLKVVGRAIQAAARVDPEMQRAFSTIPDRFAFILTVAPDGPGMVVGKDQTGKVRYLGTQPKSRYIDLKLTIKNIEAAMSLFTLRESAAMAVARKRLLVEGDPAVACSVIRILEMVAVFLLPRSMATLVVRRYPPWPSFRRYVNRMLIYLRTALGV